MEQTKTLIDFIFQYGVGFVCVAYLIYDKLVNAKENQRAMKEIVDDNKKTNQEIVVTLTKMNDRLADIEKKLDNKGE
jgi:hypothetical protein